MNQEIKLFLKSKLAQEVVIKKLKEFCLSQFEELKNAIFGTGQHELLPALQHLTVSSTSPFHNRHETVFILKTNCQFFAGFWCKVRVYDDGAAKTSL